MSDWTLLYEAEMRGAESAERLAAMCERDGDTVEAQRHRERAEWYRQCAERDRERFD